MYTPRTFSIPELKGISATNISEHMKLYAGYITNLNSALESKNAPELSAQARMEITRRISFEWNGMRNHELFFESLEGGAEELSPESLLMKKITEDFGSYENFIAEFQSVLMTRGIGWGFLSYDAIGNRLVISWVDEQHIGQLGSTTPILAIDCWEHAYLGDYLPSGRKQYTLDVMENINWSISESRFAAAQERYLHN